MLKITKSMLDNYNVTYDFPMVDIMDAQYLRKEKLLKLKEETK